MKCDIIIPVWNQLESTKNCIDNIVKNTGYPYRLIIIDNGSDDETRKYLEDIDKNGTVDVVLIRNETNLGFIKAVNQALRIADSPYMCILNNDTIPAPGWLERMVEFAEAHEDVGMMNPVCDGDPAISLEEHAKRCEKNRGRYMEMSQCFLFATLIKRDVIKKIGYLDEAFGIGCCEDADYARRALEAGYKCARVDSAYVHHAHGVSFKAMGNRNALVAHGERQYLKKWPRPIRIGIGLCLASNTSDEEVETLLKVVLFLARRWCWVNLWILGDKNSSQDRIRRLWDKAGMPAHQNIKFNFISGFKYLTVLTRIIERSFGTKSRKKYDAVLVNDDRLFGFLNAFYSAHRVELRLINSNTDITAELNKILCAVIS